jgi:DNA-binding transcriptional LysR family regulator
MNLRIIEDSARVLASFLFGLASLSHRVLVVQVKSFAVSCPVHMGYFLGSRMQGREIAELAAFAAIAERSSFVKAAGVLGVSTSKLSKMIRALEERLGVRLLNRTTRSVALTEAGEHLLAQVRPALDDLGSAVESINAFRDTPAGILRLTVSSVAAAMVIAPILGRFAATYPAITLDVSVKDGSIDLIKGRFDAGIRRDKRIEHDMTAVRISRAARVVTIASAAYLAKHVRPKAPQDLRGHNCIRFRLADGTIPRWEFEKGSRKLALAVNGSLIVDNVDLMLRGALEGVGIGYLVEPYVNSFIREGSLIPLLEDWSPRFSGWHLYYPGRRQIQTPLKVFIGFVRSINSHW